jgi:molybdopterin converting factor small subunit
VAVTVTLRFFAAARAATGVDETVWTGEQDPALGSLLASVRPAAGTDAADLEAVLARCSFLVDGVSTRDRALVVPGGATVDVMPPFAGG